MVGTVPNEEFPLVEGPCLMTGSGLMVSEQEVKIARGTPALLAAACLTAQVMGTQGPQALLAGDIGTGRGSARIYEHLSRILKGRSPRGITFHYIQPDLDWHNRILLDIEDLSTRPILVADAGYMYVAKMSGYASSYDLFTPDVGEMAFLADERAPHPFYTRGFLTEDEDRVPDLISRAYETGGAAEHLLVKGHCDHIAARGKIVAKVCEPCIDAMEPIGGTGDTLTGVVTGLLAAGLPVVESCLKGAVANRSMGALASPTPASSVKDLLHFLPRSLEDLLCSKAVRVEREP